MDKSPTLEEWKELYEAAAMFNELACWRWMDDSYVFGVQDPESGEIGYVCVLGQLGEVLGLLAYLGPEGLDVYERLQSGELSETDEEIRHMQKCLALTFEDRSDLDKDDLAVIKKLGLKFRGRQSWPLFRNHEPGFLPWYLTGGQARFLTTVIRQTMGVAEGLRENRDLRIEPKDGHYLTKVSTTDGKEMVWADEWLKPNPLPAKEPPVELDEVRLKRLKTAAQRTADAWEVDFFCCPFIVEEGERPFFPYMSLYVLRKAFQVVNFSLSNRTEYREAFLESFLAFAEETRILPSLLYVSRDTVYDFFSPLAKRLGVDLKKVKNLPALTDAKEHL